MRGTVHSVAQFLQKFFHNDKDDNSFSIDIGSCFTMDGEWSEFARI